MLRSGEFKYIERKGDKTLRALGLILSIIVFNTTYTFI